MNSMIARGMDSLMSSVNNHFRRAITEQAMPQIQDSLRAVSHANSGWGRSASRKKPERRSENVLELNRKINSRIDNLNNPDSNEGQDDSHYSIHTQQLDIQHCIETNSQEETSKSIEKWFYTLRTTLWLVRWKIALKYLQKWYGECCIKSTFLYHGF